MLKPRKLYSKWSHPGTKRSVYVPTFRGGDLLLTQFPFPIRREYVRASDAQAHAERYAIRKKAQEKRFEDQEHHTAVLTRYAAMVKFILIEAYVAEEKGEDE